MTNKNWMKIKISVSAPLGWSLCVTKLETAHQLSLPITYSHLQTDHQDGSEVISNKSLVSPPRANKLPEKLD